MAEPDSTPLATRCRQKPWNWRELRMRSSSVAQAWSKTRTDFRARGRETGCCACARRSRCSPIDPPEPDVSGLIDLLANRVGEGNLYRAAPVASDVPERAVQRIPALAPETGAEWPGHWPRPSRLLTRPEAIDTVALLPDHPPASFTWRGVRRRVTRADGPERVFGEWWKRDPELTAVRDYFRIEDDAGERYWVYRAGDGEDPLTGSQRWFLHGIFG